MYIIYIYLIALSIPFFYLKKKIIPKSEKMKQKFLCNITRKRKKKKKLICDSLEKREKMSAGHGDGLLGNLSFCRNSKLILFLATFHYSFEAEKDQQKHH